LGGSNEWPTVLRFDLGWSLHSREARVAFSRLLHSCLEAEEQANRACGARSFMGLPMIPRVLEFGLDGWNGTRTASLKTSELEASPESFGSDQRAALSAGGTR